MKTGKRIALALAATVLQAVSGRLLGAFGSRKQRGAGRLRRFGRRRTGHIPESGRGDPPVARISAPSSRGGRIAHQRSDPGQCVRRQLLGADREVLEATQIGDIDITLSNVAPWRPHGDLYLFDAPFLFETREKPLKFGWRSAKRSPRDWRAKILRSCPIRKTAFAT